MKKERLKLDDRINIQAAIAKGWTLSQIARMLKKSRSTVLREIINNSYYKECRHSCSHCALKCKDKTNCFQNDKCKKFIYYRCHKWKKFPYTCNSCPEVQYCSHLKRFYDCIKADEKSRRNRIEPRVNKKLTDEELKIIDEIVSNGVLKGQSLHHIYVTNFILQNICCERTIRRHLYKGHFTVKAHQLPRYVRYSHKYVHKEKKIRNVNRMLGRTFKDYNEFVKENPNLHIWQYDSVEGKEEDKKAVLTITFPKFRFQFGYLITKSSMVSVFNKLRKLQKLLKEKYKDIFQINLSDNGLEFTKFHEIEVDENGEVLCKTFFTTPYRFTDKASCERNHQFIRYLLPKGVSLDFLTQEKVDLMFSHINSYVRESNKNKTPYELMVESFGIEFLNLINITYIHPSDVNLKPSLIR